MATKPIHERSAQNPIRRKRAISEEAFHELERLHSDRKFEYVYGIVYMRRGCSVAHDRITRNISTMLNKDLTDLWTSFGVDVQVLISTSNSEKHFVYPDATVSCHAEDKHPYNTLIKSPGAVFEIVAYDTEARDRLIKFKAYQNCPTIQEIVLVNQYIPYVEIWQRDEQNIKVWNYRHYSSGETVVFASIDVQVEIEELYRGLKLELGEEDEDEE